MANGGPGIGVALSGGGHRAALFDLGALLYLIDAGKGPQLRSVSSVSGGSLTNAFLGHAADLSTVDSETTWAHARAFATQVARRGTLWAAPVTYLYLGSIVVLIALAVAVSFVGRAWLCAPVWVIVIALCGWLSQQRSAVVARAFDATLFRRRPLTSMNTGVSHVLCATDLQMGQTVFFSSNFVYAWRTGWGTPGDLRTARAVQASAALPAAFSVVSLPLSRFGLPQPGAPDRQAPQRFKLLDGGVYDNMGSEWLLGLGERLTEGTPPAGLHPVDEVVVVNASAGDDVIARRWVTVPFIGEIASLLAVKDVMYRQTTAVRRRLLNTRYRIARDEDRGRIDPNAGVLQEALRGATIQINRSPFEIPTNYRSGTDALAARARAAIAILGDQTREFWAAEADRNRRVKTTLSRVTPARAESLIRHGYMLSMVNCHVLLDYPLVGPPPSEKVRWLVTPDPLRRSRSEGASPPHRQPTAPQQ
jgi:predicted acylesterase/phospholipase RssA